MTPAEIRSRSSERLQRERDGDERWAGSERGYGADEVIRLRGSVEVEHSLARQGAEKLWRLLHGESHVPALGAITGNQAVQMVKAGLKAIYLSGWQVAGDGNLAESPLVRPPRWQGSRADGALRADAAGGAARSRRLQCAHRARRADGRAVGDAADERRRRARSRVHHGRADAGGLLPRLRRARAGDRAHARLRAVRRRALVRDLDTRSRRGARVRRGDPRAVPGQAARVQLLAVVQLEARARRRGDRVVPAAARRSGLPLPVRDARRLPRDCVVDVRAAGGLRPGRA